MQVFIKSNNVLKLQLTQSANPELVKELINSSKDMDHEMRDLKDQIKTYKQQMQRINQECEEVLDRQGGLPVKIGEFLEQIAACKEKLRKYQLRHDRDEKYTRNMQAEMVDLEKQIQRDVADIQEEERALRTGIPASKRGKRAGRERRVTDRDAQAIVQLEQEQQQLEREGEEEHLEFRKQVLLDEKKVCLLSLSFSFFSLFLRALSSLLYCC